MQELITITEQKGVQLVDARELHRKLKTGRDFSNWIKGRIKEYRFVENEDYFIENHRSPILASQEIAKGGFNKIDYHISIDMAKELAMIEKNEMGRKIRRYFIEMEKIALRSIIKMPRTLNVYGKEVLPYVEWLLMNGHSVTSGQVHRRIKKYPHQFYKSSEGKWYINREFAEQLLKMREGYKALNQVQGLPQVKQITIFDVINQ